MLRRFAVIASNARALVTALTLTSAVTSLTVTGAAPAALAQDGALGPQRPLDGGTQLTITVSGAGEGTDGTYRLRCSPSGGTHPDVMSACGRLEELAATGEDPFAAPSQRTVCTMMYGGSATAHITGTWHGRPVDAHFERTDGCEIGRWNALVPVLPAPGP